MHLLFYVLFWSLTSGLEPYGTGSIALISIQVYSDPSLKSQYTCILWSISQVSVYRYTLIHLSSLIYMYTLIHLSSLSIQVYSDPSLKSQYTCILWSISHVSYTCILWSISQVSVYMYTLIHLSSLSIHVYSDPSLKSQYTYMLWSISQVSVYMYTLIHLSSLSIHICFDPSLKSQYTCILWSISQVSVYLDTLIHLSSLSIHVYSDPSLKSQYTCMLPSISQVSVFMYALIHLSSLLPHPSLCPLPSSPSIAYIDSLFDHRILSSSQTGTLTICTYFISPRLFSSDYHCCDAQNVPQASQHHCSTKLLASCDACFASVSVCVVPLTLPRTVDPQMLLKLKVTHICMLKWVLCPSPHVWQQIWWVCRGNLVDSTVLVRSLFGLAWWLASHLYMSIFKVSQSPIDRVQSQPVITKWSQPAILIFNQLLYVREVSQPS